MTERYFPFDDGPGKNIMESDWSLMARNFLGTGVISNRLNELQVYADSTGMQSKVKTGNAFMEGHFYLNDAEVILPHSAAHATLPRIDRIILRVDWTANTVGLAVLPGTPAGAPAAPALTQLTGVKWEISLAQVRVDAAVATIAANKVTDERNFVINSPQYGTANGGYYLKHANGVLEQWGVAPVTGGTPTDVTFPLSFVSLPQCVTITPDNWTNTFTVTSKATNKCAVQVNGAGTVYVNWSAKGRWY